MTNVMSSSKRKQEAWALVESEERSVGTYYVNTAAFASVQDSPPTKLQRKTASSKSSFLNYLSNKRSKSWAFRTKKLGR
ncbi:hypothetical protein J40TS1_35530 [Paenibacillus montaniterrae]|uniref:Uncharacterized protein n=1 Tax=Paenibacillus montaniterrae TaxID=429341 RepID=A0A919YT27_9BACL|nr:hypothetical protein J40TS1_35530 [Paenibacillus montaniterrae]